MRVPPKVPVLRAGPITADQLRLMATQPETATIVVLVSPQMLAHWLDGGVSFADPDPTHTRVVVLEAVHPVGTLVIEGTVFPLADLTFKETVHYVEEAPQEAPPA